MQPGVAEAPRATPEPPPLRSPVSPRSRGSRRSRVIAGGSRAAPTPWEREVNFGGKQRDLAFSNADKTRPSAPGPTRVHRGRRSQQNSSGQGSGSHLCEGARAGLGDTKTLGRAQKTFPGFTSLKLKPPSHWFPVFYPIFSLLNSLSNSGHPIPLRFYLFYPISAPPNSLSNYGHPVPLIPCILSHFSP